MTQEQTPATSDCPRVRRNRLTPDDDMLTMNQEAILVHELVHLYGVRPFASWLQGDFESYKVGECVNLESSVKLTNAANFAYYYSGTLREFLARTLHALLAGEMFLFLGNPTKKQADSLCVCSKCRRLH